MKVWIRKRDWNNINSNKKTYKMKNYLLNYF